MRRLYPVQVSGLNGVQAVSAGRSHSLALQGDGTAWSWGNNEHGQLGDNTTTNKNTPVQVSDLSGVQAISGGGYHSMALKDDGTVWSWGWNFYGQLGDGTSETRLTPEQVSMLSGVQVITSGYGGSPTAYSHSLALHDDGTVWSWGLNKYGQLGDGTTLDRHSPVKSLINLIEVELPPDSTQLRAIILDLGNMKVEVDLVDYGDAYFEGKGNELYDYLRGGNDKPFVHAVASGNKYIEIITYGNNYFIYENISDTVEHSEAIPQAEVSEYWRFIGFDEDGNAIIEQFNS